MRRHRNEAAYPTLWRAIDGAVRDAMNAHDDIKIPERRVASIVKRAVGALLADRARAGSPAGMDGAQPHVSPYGAHLAGVEGAVKCEPPPHPPEQPLQPPMETDPSEIPEREDEPDLPEEWGR